MCFSGARRACPEFCFTGEEIKKFLGKLRIATKLPLAHSSQDSAMREEKFNRALSKIIKDVSVLLQRPDDISTSDL